MAMDHFSDRPGAIPHRATQTAPGKPGRQGKTGRVGVVVLNHEQKPCRTSDRDRFDPALGHQHNANFQKSDKQVRPPDPVRKTEEPRRCSKQDAA